MPPWHAAPPRNAGAAAGLGAAVTGRGAAAAGLMGGGNGCCAVAADESVKHAATLMIAIRIAGKGIGIKVTGRAKIYGPFEYRKIRPKGNPRQRSPD
jgi:hypothetical protein